MSQNRNGLIRRNVALMSKLAKGALSIGVLASITGSIVWAIDYRAKNDAIVRNQIDTLERQYPYVSPIVILADHDELSGKTSSKATLETIKFFIKVYERGRKAGLDHSEVKDTVALSTAAISIGDSRTIDENEEDLILRYQQIYSIGKLAGSEEKAKRFN